MTHQDIPSAPGRTVTEDEGDREIRAVLEATDAAEGGVPTPVEPAVPSQRRFGRGRGSRSHARLPLAAITWLVILSLAAIFAALLTPFDPTEGSLGASLLAPGETDSDGNLHLLGTDRTGRDILTLLLYGARISIVVGLVGVAIAGIIGTTIGLIAGTFGKIADTLLMRLVDIVLSIPPILLAILVAVTMRPSIVTVFLVIGLLLWPNYARLVRGEVLVIREADYVKLARVAGCSTWTIMRRHILPNVMPSILVLATLQVGVAIILESSLSFLGIGLPPTSASWGGLINQGMGVMSIAWWISVIPGLIIFLTVYACNSVGDWARVRFDPRLGGTA
jgi:peptide/nickel transport system permease protein